MPKISQTPLQRCVRFQQMFPQEFIINSNLQLECILCICSVKADKKHNVISHRKSTKHQRHLQQQQQNSDFTPPLLDFSSSSNLSGLTRAKLDFSPASLGLAGSKLDFTRSNLDLNHVDGEQPVMNEYNMKQMMLASHITSTPNIQTTSDQVGSSSISSSPHPPLIPEIVKVANGLVKNWVGTSGFTGEPQQVELKQRKRKNNDQQSMESPKRFKLSKTLSGREFQRNNKRLLKGKTIQEKFLQYQRGQMKKKETMKKSMKKTCVKIEHLSPMVSNELLAESFHVFGVVDRAVVIVNNKGESTRRGIVEFNNEQAAINAVQRIQEGSFLMTSSPRPISATIMEHEDSEVGLPEEKLPKSTQYYTERKKQRRFAVDGSFEDGICRTWKAQYKLEEEERKQFDEKMKVKRKLFEMEMENFIKQHHNIIRIQKKDALHRQVEELSRKAARKNKERNYDDEMVGNRKINGSDFRNFVETNGLNGERELEIENDETLLVESPTSVENEINQTEEDTEPEAVTSECKKESMNDEGCTLNTGGNNIKIEQGNDSEVERNGGETSRSLARRISESIDNLNNMLDSE